MVIAPSFMNDIFDKFTLLKDETTKSSSDSSNSDHLKTLKELSLPLDWLCVMDRYELKSEIGLLLYPRLNPLAMMDR